MTELQEQWLKALESGEFKQTDATLQEVDDEGNDRYCCLGVACRIAGVKGKLEGGSLAKYPEVMDVFGFYNDLGGARAYINMSLATLNDEGKTFKQIAEIVRANPEHYFVNAKSEEVA